MSGKKLVFFDFDGTLTRGGLQAMQKNKLLDTFKVLTQFTPNTSGDFSSKMKSMVFEQLWAFYVKGKSEWEIKRDINQLINDPKQKIELFEGVKEKLNDLNLQGHEMHIISRSPVEFIESILLREGAKTYFKGIHATEAEKKAKEKEIEKFEIKKGIKLDAVKKHTFYTGRMAVKPMTPQERAKKMISIIGEKNDEVVIVGDSWTDVQTTVKLIDLLKKTNKKNKVSLVIQQQKGMEKIKKTINGAGGKVVFSKHHPVENIKKAFI